MQGGDGQQAPREVNEQVAQAPVAPDCAQGAEEQDCVAEEHRPGLRREDEEGRGGITEWALPVGALVIVPPNGEVLGTCPRQRPCRCCVVVNRVVVRLVHDLRRRVVATPTPVLPSPHLEDVGVRERDDGEREGHRKRRRRRQ